MNKRKTFIFIIAILVLSVPIIAWAKAQYGVPVVNEKSDEEILKEKMEYTENRLEINKQLQKNTKSNGIEEQKELDIETIQEEAKKESRKNNEQIIDIMNKFYPGRFEKILENIEKESEGVIFTNDTVLESHKELFNLIIEIIETKTLSDEETKILKDFLDDTRDNVAGDIQLTDKINEVLK